MRTFRKGKRRSYRGELHVVTKITSEINIVRHEVAILAPDRTYIMPVVEAQALIKDLRNALRTLKRS